LLVYIKLLLTAFIWGGTFIAGRFVAQNVEPYSASFLRFAVASVCLVFFVWKMEGNFPALKKRQILPVVLLGMTGIFSYNIFFFKGLKIIDAGRAAIIIANNPVFITLLASYFFRERLNIIKLAGVAISVTGAIVVISHGNPIEILNGSLGWGELYIFFCVLSWVAFSLIGKSVLSDLSPVVAVTYSSIAGTVFLFFPAWLLEGIAFKITTYSFSDWMGIVYLGFFGTALGFLWYYEGINKIGPSRASLFINFVPVSAVFLAFFMLNEPLTLALLTGTAMVSSGVYLTNSKMAGRSLQIPAER
jgi:drug/metabolite transporter (DMT)-like permease